MSQQGTHELVSLCATLGSFLLVIWIRNKELLPPGEFGVRTAQSGAERDFPCWIILTSLFVFLGTAKILIWIFDMLESSAWGVLCTSCSYQKSRLIFLPSRGTHLFTCFCRNEWALWSSRASSPQICRTHEYLRPERRDRMRFLATIGMFDSFLTLL